MRLAPTLAALATWLVFMCNYSRKGIAQVRAVFPPSSWSYCVVWIDIHHMGHSASTPYFQFSEWKASITLLRVIPTMTFIHFVTGKSSGILSDISSGILSGISSGILPGISSGILSGRWGPAVHTELGRSRVERRTLSWEGPRLRSSGAHWAGQVPGWGPAVHTELGRSQVKVQRCTLSWEGPRLRSSGAHWAGKLAKSLAKSWQGGSWCRHGRGETGEGGGRGRGGGGEGGEELAEEEKNNSDKI